MTKQPDTLNPLDAIDPNSTTALDDCHDLAKALVVRSTDEKEPHWNDSAETWITACIALVVAYGGTYGTRSLQTVRELISDPTRLTVDDAVTILLNVGQLYQALSSSSGSQP